MAEQKKELTAIDRAQAWLSHYEKAFVDIVDECDVPVTFKREAGFALQLLSTNDFTLKVALSNPDSLRHAVLNVARTGLTLDPSRRLAYLVPRDGRVIFQPSYMGMIAQATDSGSIKSVHVDLVHENDVWEYEERASGPHLIHRRPRLNQPRGNLEGAYVRVVLPDGSTQVNVVPLEYLERCMNQSDAVKKNRRSAYTDWSDQMHLKSAVRFASKFWPRVVNPRLVPATAFNETGDPDYGGGFANDVARDAQDVTPINADQVEQIETAIGVLCVGDESEMRLFVETLLRAFGRSSIDQLPARRFAECMLRIDEARQARAHTDAAIRAATPDHDTGAPASVETTVADDYDMPPANDGSRGPF